MPLASNQQLFEYRVERVLGHGAFGTVYLAHDTRLDCPVAIRGLTVTAQTDEMAFKCFLQEARATGGLNHPHVVAIHAVKVVGADVYLVMEYLAGGSLRALLEKHGSLPVRAAVRIAADVCEGLAAARAQGIVHRDVKPENVLLTEDGQAKVGDFGIAHLPRGADGAYLSALTATRPQPETLLYMSPEQVRGQEVDGRSDAYQAALRINPDDAEVHVNLGNVYQQQGRLDQAIREYQAALHIKPDDALAHYNLGVDYKAQGRLDEAIRELQIAAQLGLEPAKKMLAKMSQP